jgi:hypothetical protein
MRTMAKTGLLIACVLMVCAGAMAQEFRTVENPFQEEFPYRVPNDLRPMVDVDMIRWSKMTIAPKKGKSIVTGKLNAVTVSLELENLNTRTANVLFIVLLENENGQKIGRFEAKKIKVRGEKTTTYSEKAKIEGQVLQDTAKIWVLFEVTR